MVGLLGENFTIFQLPWDDMSCLSTNGGGGGVNKHHDSHCLTLVDMGYFDYLVYMGRGKKAPQV